MPLDETHFKELKDSLGLAALAVKRLDKAFCAKFADEFDVRHSDNALGHAPEYLLRSLELRRSPLRLYPWAKAVVIAAVPFNVLPPPNDFLPESQVPELSGFIAGYAARLDYHIYAKGLLAKFADDLRGMSGGPCRFEFCVDAEPVAEKSLAVAAGAGRIGRNTCLLVQGHGSGCFLCEMFTDMPLDDFKTQGFKLPCDGCEACMQACEPRALNPGSGLSIDRCRSSLLSEKRGPLSAVERKSLGFWIFGCDECTACCPGSELPRKFSADLQWLLLQPAAEVRRAVRNTPLDHAGVTLLRRNALAVLANRNTPGATALVAKFARMTSSPVLKSYGESILEGS